VEILLHPIRPGLDSPPGGSPRFSVSMSRNQHSRKSGDEGPGVRGPTQRDMVRGFTIGYDLGAVGTWVRILIGVVASLALVTIDVTSDDVGAGFLAGALAFFLGILGVYTVVYLLLAPRILPKLNPWASTVLFYGPVLVLPYVDGLPGTFRVAMSIYVTVSIVVVVFVRYGGCEVVGIPSLIVGRRYVVYCPWNTVDLVDKAIQDSPWSDRLHGVGIRTAGVVVAVVVIGVGGFMLGDAFPLVWVLAAAASVAVVAVGVLLSRLAGRTE